MRPTLDQSDSGDDSGRIIYLGDVRRRRVGRKRAPDRQYIAGLFAVALISFAAWLVVLAKVPPQKLLTYVAFFTPLWLTLSAVCALGAYWLEWRTNAQPELRGPSRRGIIFSTLVIANLAAVAAHYWSWPVGALSLLAVVLIAKGTAGPD